MKFSQLAALLNVRTSTETEFNGVSIDTRALQPGQLFIAIQGAHFDGHDFVVDAIQKQAAAILIEKDNVFSEEINTVFPCLKVNHTVQALGTLAAHHRAQFTIPVIGITGSCGKTTTRALTASILSQAGHTIFSESSYNNEIGLPLTLLRLDPSHQYAVIEMGANHFGEIAYLTHIAKPTVAVITNAAEAHLEGFGDVAGVCRAKGEIFEGLPEQGIAILNADDPHFSEWQRRVLSFPKNLHILSFGLNPSTDIRAKKIDFDSEGRPHFICITPGGEIEIHLPLAGEHNITNALAAAAAAYAIHIPLHIIQTGLSQVSAVSKRLNYYTLPNGTCLIDDTYNANPLSVKAAIALLSKRAGEKILVLGDMKELGEHTETAHRAVGTLAHKLGIDQLYTYGTHSALSNQTFGKAARHFNDHAELIEALKKTLSPKINTILIKGSRSMKMEQVVEALRNVHEITPASSISL